MEHKTDSMYTDRDAAGEVGIRVENVSPGFSWRVLIDYDLDEDGRPIKSTAERIVGGWAPTHAEALSEANRALVEAGE